jgi:H+/Cl- antiporter ClcA
MGFVWLLLIAAAIAFGMEVWLKRWWISLLTPVPTYVGYVWLEVNVLPHTGGFPGWEMVLLNVVPVVLVGAVCGLMLARWFRRSPDRRPNAL